MCSVLENPAHGLVFVQGLMAYYICDEGYKLYGVETLECLEEESAWSGSAPVCIRKMNIF